MKTSYLLIIVALTVLIGLYFVSDRTSTPTSPTSMAQENTSSSSLQVPGETTSPKLVVTITTNHGTIKFEMYPKDAPKTVQNFMSLANKGFYNNLIFHRVVTGFVIQGGDPKGDGMGGPGYSFADELNPNTESYKNGYKKGVVAMANAGPNTNGSQFFIMLQDYPLPHNYTIFGHVIEGQDVVDAIGKLPVGPGNRPLSPVIMKSVVTNYNNAQ